MSSDHPQSETKPVVPKDAGNAVVENNTVPTHRAPNGSRPYQTAAIVALIVGLIALAGSGFV